MLCPCPFARLFRRWTQTDVEAARPARQSQANEAARSEQLQVAFLLGGATAQQPVARGCQLKPVSRSAAGLVGGRAGARQSGGSSFSRVESARDALLPRPRLVAETAKAAKCAVV
ncbi:hypothetical protein NDU88_004480 [Pleurodeles waltl]|uniref:Uncharacterized protein n=1 Tax=Pleurodeles waltl TaxID=8319 RepID=A0AAV7QCQ8_PLEWA|nr:hypothetical protein NDU88_004480 [Pleurodeles waltl]